MILIIGLGNPGDKFEGTRHNIGFRIVEEFARENNFSEFEFSKKFNALISEKNLNKKRMVISKPQTFMNESGKSVKSLISFYKINKEKIIVIHDDIDLPLGTIRIAKNRGAAGHRGINSIIKEIGTKNFIRFRIGIRNENYKPKGAKDLVLKRFTKEEEKNIREVTRETIKALDLSLKENLEKAMSIFNK